jgi:hypothetical protein
LANAKQALGATELCISAWQQQQQKEQQQQQEQEQQLLLLLLLLLLRVQGGSVFFVTALQELVMTDCDQ